MTRILYHSKCEWCPHWHGNFFWMISLLQGEILGNVYICITWSPELTCTIVSLQVLVLHHIWQPQPNQTGENNATENILIQFFFWWNLLIIPNYSQIEKIVNADQCTSIRGPLLACMGVHQKGNIAGRQGVGVQRSYILLSSMGSLYRVKK